MNAPEPSNLSGKLDRAAVALSMLCLAHCLLLPVAIALFPVIGFELIDHATYHQLILVVVVPTSAVALGIGLRRHGRAVVIVLGGAGVLALVIAAFVVHSLMGHELERALTMAGGLLLAMAHLQNYRATRRAGCHTGAPSSV